MNLVAAAVDFQRFERVVPWQRLVLSWWMKARDRISQSRLLATILSLLDCSNGQTSSSASGNCCR